MTLLTFLLLCNVWIFCSLIYYQVRVRRREAEIEENGFWLRYINREEYEWD